MTAVTTEVDVNEKEVTTKDNQTNSKKLRERRRTMMCRKEDLKSARNNIKRDNNEQYKYKNQSTPH